MLGVHGGAPTAPEPSETVAPAGEGKGFHRLTHAVERGWAILREIEEGKWAKAEAKSGKQGRKAGDRGATRPRRVPPAHA